MKIAVKNKNRKKRKERGKKEKQKETAIELSMYFDRGNIKRTQQQIMIK